MVSPMGTPYRVPKSMFGFATSEGVAQAQQDASDALQAANAAGQTASAADQTAQAADQTAQAAAQDAATALQDASQAIQDAANAQQTANTAVQDAANAQQTANQALQDASDADAAAISAGQSAASAQQTANQAVQDASNAQQAANTANQWIASPLSTQSGNQASLISGKIFVGAAVATLGTVSSPVTVSNTNAETILASFPVAGGVTQAGDILDLMWAIRKGPAGHTGTVRVYLNTSNAIGGTTLHNVANGFNSSTMFMYNQKYAVTSSGLVIPNPVNASGGTNLTNFQTQSAMGSPASFNPATNYWLIVTSTQSAGNSLEILEFAKLLRIR